MNGSAALLGDSKKNICWEDPALERGDTLRTFIICGMDLLVLSGSPDNNFDVYDLKI